MQAVINIVFPVFAIILTGYLAGRFKVLGPESSQALNKFVFYVAMPALLFQAMARLTPQEIFHLPFMLTYGALRALACAYCNIGYMGLSLVIIAFGPDWTAAAVMITTALSVATLSILFIIWSERIL